MISQFGKATAVGVVLLFLATICSQRLRHKVPSLSVVHGGTVRSSSMESRRSQRAAIRRRTSGHVPHLTGPPPPSYKLKAVATGAVVARDQRDTNFPSVIKVPDWIAPQDRAHVDAKYYLYFSSHSANYISLSWASDIKGPWIPYNFTSGPFYVNGLGRQTRGVMDFDADADRSDWDHASSPDVHIVGRTFIMYFHGRNGPDSSNGHQLDHAKVHHRGFVATSATGLNFNGPRAGGEAGHGPVTVTYGGVTTEVCLNDEYSRIFYRRRKHGNTVKEDGPFAISKFGQVSRPLDFDHPFAPLRAQTQLPIPTIDVLRKVQPTDCAWVRYDTPTDIFKASDAGKLIKRDTSALSTFLASEEFADHPKNPHPGYRIGTGGDPIKLNHVGIFPLNDGTDRLEVFFWVKSKRRMYLGIYRLILDISNDEMSHWDVSRHPGTRQVYFDVIATPEMASRAIERAMNRRARKKGGNSMAQMSDSNAYALHIGQLGDPFIFYDEETDKKYLFVAYANELGSTPVRNTEGEGQITSFRLEYK